MIGELSSALPFEGGYYAWVRRAMGNFWGFQEAWLSLVASIFDMAIYPTLFVAYLTRMFPWFQENHRGVAVALGVVIVCAILNIMGVKVVSTTSLWLFFALSAPFAAIFVLAPFKIHALANAVTKPTTSNVDILGGLLICMWNYMGWDNASTHRDRSGASAADLSSRDAGCGGDCVPDVMFCPLRRCGSPGFRRERGRPALGPTLRS